MKVLNEVITENKNSSIWIKEETEYFSKKFNSPLYGIEKQKNLQNFYYILAEIINLKKHKNKEQLVGIIFSENETLSLLNKYGYIIQKNFENISDGKKVFNIVSSGMRSFLESESVFVFEKEFNHYEILRELKSFCIISKKDSIINIYYRNTITSIDGRLWSFHGDTTLIAQRLNQYFPKLSGASKDRLGLLLNFANYELSMDRIGTTIVYHDENKKTFPLESVKNAETISLFIHDEQTLKSKKLKDEKVLLKNYLMFHDGAIVVDNAKEVFLGCAQLTYNPATKIQDIKGKGTRHNSALKYSGEHSTEIIFVVSEDGPISIFHKGKLIDSTTSVNTQTNIVLEKQITSHSNESTTSSYIITDEDVGKKIFENDQLVDSHVETKKCPKCGALHKIEYVKVSGWNEKESVECLSCHYPDLLSRLCYDMKASLVK